MASPLTKQEIRTFQIAFIQHPVSITVIRYLKRSVNLNKRVLKPKTNGVMNLLLFVVDVQGIIKEGN